MTGLGTHVAESRAGRFEAEARSVNHRFLKVTVRLGPGLETLEPLAEERVRSRVERGHVTLLLRHSASPRSAAAGPRVDEKAAEAAAKRLRSLAKRLSLEGGVTLRDLLAVPGVVADGREGSLSDAVVASATAAVDGALDALATSREREGGHLAAECGALLDRIAKATEAIAERAPEVPKAYRDRLAARVSALLEDGAPVDPAHLAREIATFADRADVTEEVARLRAHVAHARELLAAGGAAGRRLDFLVQEMNREANTTGSKSQDATLSSVVIDLKADVERLREQVQNLE